MRDTDQPAATPTPDSARAFPPGRPTRKQAPSAGPPAARETTRLVCAVTLAASLGVACGLWINARLASAASAFAAAPARLLPRARATPPTADASTAPEPPPAGPFETPSPVEEAAPTSATGAADEAEPPRANHVAAAGESPVLKRGRGNPAAPAAGEPGSSVEAARRKEAAPVASGSGTTARRGQGALAPCSLYASASALTIRNGGAASLVLGGPGGAGHVSVTTPHWADIAVLSEGPAGGRGWVKYSVRSVSKRPGGYAVHVKSPCGSQSIPVTVARP